MSANKKRVTFMKLTKRKLLILKAVVNDYIQNAEPVGSRTLSRKYDLGVGAATIRNEMADLEDMGLLVQPYTSAGRIPTEDGYKVYVNNLMEDIKIDRQDELNLLNLINENDSFDLVLLKAIEYLSKITNYTSLAIKPRIIEYEIKHIQLVPVDETKILLVVVTRDNKIKNIMLNVNNMLSADKLYIISNMLNEKLAGKAVSSLDDNFINYIKKEITDYNEELDQMMNSLLEGLYENIKSMDKIKIYSKGTTNIMDFPEFFDIVKAKAFLDIIEKEDNVLELINSKGIEKRNVNIIIGNENNEIMNECSIITATYDIDGEIKGKFGIIGPKRMDYARVYGVINYISKILNKYKDKK